MDPLDRYQKYRTVGKDLNTWMIENLLDRATIDESAARLDLLNEEGRVRYETGMDMAVHQEFLIHEPRQSRKTPVERFFEQELWQSSVERAVIGGMRRSDTSLFRVSSVDSTENRLVLDDVLNDETGIEVVDIGLSDTVNPSPLLFFRRLPFDSFDMTAGMVLPFAGDLEEHLLAVYDQVRDRVTSRPASVTRFVAFYKLFKKYGSEIQTVESLLSGDGPESPLTDPR